MSRILEKLDPRRSLTTAVAWLAVVLSMVVTLATLGISDHTRQRLLTERDALMMRFVTAVASDLETSLDGGDVAAALARFPAIAQQQRERVRPDPRARVLLLNERQEILAASPPMDAGLTAPANIPGTSLQPASRGRRHVVMTAPRRSDTSPERTEPARRDHAGQRGGGTGRNGAIPAGRDVAADQHRGGAHRHRLRASPDAPTHPADLGRATGGDGPRDAPASSPRGTTKLPCSVARSCA